MFGYAVCALFYHRFSGFLYLNQISYPNLFVSLREKEIIGRVELLVKDWKDAKSTGNVARARVDVVTVALCPYS